MWIYMVLLERATYNAHTVVIIFGTKTFYQIFLSCYYHV